MSGPRHPVLSIHPTGRKLARRGRIGGSLMPEYACDACGRPVFVAHPVPSDPDRDYLEHGADPATVRAYAIGEDTAGWQAAIR